MQAKDGQSDTSRSAPPRKPRKSRGRGLRTTTGCAVCRKRHTKCDEIRPVCGPCAKGDRNCVYGTVRDAGRRRHDGEPPLASPGAQSDLLWHPATRHTSLSSNQESMTPAPRPLPSPSPDDNITNTSPQSSYSTPASYGTEKAPLRWFGLFATDAADVNLDLSSVESLDGRPLFQSQRLPTNELDYQETSTQALAGSTTLPDGLLAQNPHSHHQTSSLSHLALNGSKTESDEKQSWQASEPLQLKDHEFDMFERFVSNVSHWIDLFDPLQHFSAFVPHLALHNTGLMKSILALGARHLSIKPLPGRDADADRTAAVQYYDETLQYLQEAMRYTSYKNSLELLATVLVISTSEMIDGAGKEWERHLKGVFWIQRNRDINGESGNFEQAVWWAWLRQDVWAAFREKRRCFSSFKPTKSYEEMDIWDMASRIVYMLAQSVNYSSDEEKQQGEADLANRIARANNILDMLEEWKRSISIHFEPLSVNRQTNTPFQPLWIHPSALGASLQMYCMAKILLLIHQPAPGGYLEYLGRDRGITQSIDTIGGIAMKLTNDASKLVSTQCLFAAGLYCSDETKRERIAELIHDHSSHTGWPDSINLLEELRTEWLNQRPATS